MTSLIATCKRHHIDPFAYMRDVLARIGAHPQNRLEKLLADNWLAAGSAATV
jgi:transposase